MTTLQIDEQELGKFILEAKRNTWASGKKAENLVDGSKRFIFSNELYIYKDTYFATNSIPFIGQEIVYRKGSNHSIPSATPIWGMNYYGKLTEDGEKYPDKNKLVDFLREALMANDNLKKPFRGQYGFNNGYTSKLIDGMDGLLYRNGATSGKDNILDFKGEELISTSLSRFMRFLYQLEYHGGKL